jgi:hypothetical protein
MEQLFYSNCLIQAIKAKIKNPKKVKITYISPFKNEIFCPHFMWSDGIDDYDFTSNTISKWYQEYWFKGYIRKRTLGFNEKYKKHTI